MVAWLNVGGVVIRPNLPEDDLRTPINDINVLRWILLCLKSVDAQQRVNIFSGDWPGQRASLAEYV